MQPNATLTGRPRQIVELIVAGATQAEAAAVLKCHRTTVWRLLQRPDVRAALAEADREVWGAVRRKAVAHLDRTLSDDAVSVDTKLIADRIVLTHEAAIRAHRVDATVAVTPPFDRDKRPPKEILLESLDRAARRMGETDQVLLTNGSGSTNGAKQ